MIPLIFSLAGLWFGTELVVNGALQIARRFALSQFFIGIAILAVGTDLPELVVAIRGAFEIVEGNNVSGLITGNALGSCIAQITLVLGVSMLIGGQSMRKKGFHITAGFLLGSIVFLFLFGVDNEISLPEGTFLIAIYLVYYFLISKCEGDSYTSKKTRDPLLWKDIILFVSGLVLLLYMSGLVIENAVMLSEEWDVPQSLVGILIIGPGTSLPELAVSISAAFKRAGALSIGNILGSNIFDTLIPIAGAALVTPIFFSQKLLLFELPILFFISLLVLVFLRSQKQLRILHSSALIVTFFVYTLIKYLGYLA